MMRSRIVFVFAAAVALSGCTSKAWYEGMRGMERQKCYQIENANERQACLDRVEAESYDQYHKEIKSAEAQQTAVDAALVWLPLIDQGNYSDSWKRASAYFRSATPEAGWVAAMNGVRAPLGNPVRRKMMSMQEQRTLPGAPDGIYMVMSFETVFENKQAAMEMVTFLLEGEAWKAAGYYIR